jgi:hypothetical protein
MKDSGENTGSQAGQGGACLGSAALRRAPGHSGGAAVPCWAAGNSPGWRRAEATRLACAPDAILYFDDEAASVPGAREAGLSALLLRSSRLIQQAFRCPLGGSG